MGFGVSLLNKTMHHYFTPLYSSALCLVVGFEAQFITVGDMCLHQCLKPLIKFFHVLFLSLLNLGIPTQTCTFSFASFHSFTYS